MSGESAPELIAEYLKLVAADDYTESGKLLTPDCKFSLMPAGRTWQGRDQVMAFVTSAGGRCRHDARSKVAITNCNPTKFWLSILLTIVLRMLPMLVRVSSSSNQEEAVG